MFGLLRLFELWGSQNSYRDVAAPIIPTMLSLDHLLLCGEVVLYTLDHFRVKRLINLVSSFTSWEAAKHFK